MSYASMYKKAGESLPDTTGMFLKLRDHKDTAEVLLVGEPYQHTQPARGDYGARTVMAIPLAHIIKGEGPKLQVLEWGPKHFNSLVGFLEAGEEDGVDWAKTTFKIRRNGAKGDQNTSYMFMVGKTLDDDKLAVVNGLDPIDVPKLVSGGGSDDDGEDSGESHDAPDTSDDDDWG